MNIWSKFNTLLRAGVRESVEQVTDANAVRIYRQEIIEAEEMLAQRRDALGAMIASRRELERDIERTRGRIRKREQQLLATPAAERSETLLQYAAGDIAGSEAHLEVSQGRHARLCSRIGEEELLLRQLLREINEHRRDIKLLQAQLARNHGHLKTASSQTVSSRLAMLRDTRNAIGGNIDSAQHLEAGMEEAQQRVAGDPMDAYLAERGQDEDSLRVGAVLQRLRGLGGEATPASTGDP